MGPASSAMGREAGLNLWSLWSGCTDRRTSRLFAAAVPVGYRASFLVAPLVEAPGGWPLDRRAGDPANAEEPK